MHMLLSTIPFRTLNHHIHHTSYIWLQVSDPIIFGHVVRTFLKPVFEKHADSIKAAGVNANYGLSDLYEKLKKLPEDTQKEIMHDIQETFNKRPWLAMVDSGKVCVFSCMLSYIVYPYPCPYPYAGHHEPARA